MELSRRMYYTSAVPIIRNISGCKLERKTYYTKVIINSSNLLRSGGSLETFSLKACAVISN